KPRNSLRFVQKNILRATPGGSSALLIAEGCVMRIRTLFVRRTCRFWSPRRAALALAVSIPIGCLLAQQADQPVVIKATTRLVLLSVIANRSNQPVADLTKDDFRVKVNGKVQPISVFSMESAHGAPSSLQSASFGPSVTPQGTLPLDVFSNRLAVQSGTPSSVNVILLDARNTRAVDQIYAKAEIVRYLHTLRPTDHVGVYTFGGT